MEDHTDSWGDLNGGFPMLKARTPFAIDSQKDLNAQAPNQLQPPA